MKRIQWVLFGVAVTLSCVVAIVRAQSDDVFAAESKAVAEPAERAVADDPFGVPLASQSGNQDPSGPTPAPVPDDFGTIPAFPKTTQESAPRLQPGAVQPVPEVPNDSFCRCQGDANRAAIAKIEGALHTQLRSPGLEFVDTPLEEVINVLQDEYDVPIQIDTPALDEQGISGDEPVSINVRGISLGSALRLMLKSIQLTYMIEDEVLLITTPTEAESRMKVCVYDVRDLIDANPSASLKQLTEVVTSCVSSESWEGNRGRGAVRSYPPNLLVISQPQPVHEQIQDLLKRMRQMRGPSSQKVQPTVPARK
jgi:hypothetical protein